MEAFMYRCHPQTQKLVELIKGSSIGDVRVIQATNSFNEPFDPRNRLYNKSLGGGGILDIGCYPASMARLLAGAAGNKDFSDPIDVQSVGYVGATDVDEYTIAVLKFPNNILASISAGRQ